jgi:hypothetical protein
VGGERAPPLFVVLREPRGAGAELSGLQPGIGVGGWACPGSQFLVSDQIAATTQLKPGLC